LTRSVFNQIEARLGGTQSYVTSDSPQTACYHRLLEENRALLNRVTLSCDPSSDASHSQQLLIKHLQLKNARLTTFLQEETDCVKLLCLPREYRTSHSVKAQLAPLQGREYGVRYDAGFNKAFDVVAATVDEAPCRPVPVPRLSSSQCVHCRRMCITASHPLLKVVWEGMFHDIRPIPVTRKKVNRSLDDKCGMSTSSDTTHRIRPHRRIDPEECTHCKRTFTTASIACHIRVCESIFGGKKVLLTSKPAAPLPSTRNVSEYARCDNVDSTIEKKTNRTYRSPPDLCPHCRRTFVTDAFACHAHVCASVFGAKREAFNARESFLGALYCKYGVVNSASNKVGASAKAARSRRDFHLQRAALLEGVRTRRKGVTPRDGGDELLIHWPGAEAYAARHPGRDSTMPAGQAHAGRGGTLVSALRALVFGRRSVDVIAGAAAAPAAAVRVIPTAPATSSAHTSGGAARSVDVSGCAESSARPVPVPPAIEVAPAPATAPANSDAAPCTGVPCGRGTTPAAQVHTTPTHEASGDKLCSMWREEGHTLSKRP
jgi:hypothetical protein